MKKRRNCCYLQCFCAVRSRNHCKYHCFWGSGGQKHCNLQCFFNQRQKTLVFTMFSSKNGSKNSKIRLRARPPAEPQKKMLQTKKLRSKSWKTRVFFTFRLPILDGRVHEQVSSVLFFTVFFEGERHDLSKNRRFWPKNAPPPQVNL